MRSTLRLVRLGIENVRNLASAVFEPSEHFTVLSGDNGQGKTSVLEAVYLLCRGQSFRTSALTDVARDGGSSFRLAARVSEDGVIREQSFTLEGGTRKLSIEGKRPRSVAEYALRTPAVVFHPGELTLSMGSAQLRRQLLDRVAFFHNPAHARTLADYTKAQRERQRALADRGVHARDLDQWEELIVQHGSELMRRRLEAASMLERETAAAFAEVAARGLNFSATYQPSAPLEAEGYRRRLAEARVRDAARGSASYGPHRDEWQLSLAGRDARSTASQGQHRALVLAIKSAEIEVVARARHVQPLVLLDDVSSELDRDRTLALFLFLRRQRGQVILTTTRPELVELGENEALERIDWVLREGVWSAPA